jgi:F-type H+-transporting ATPase subunit alpha
MRQVAGRLRMELSQFREVQAFAQFGTSELDVATRRQLERGQRLTEVLKQPQYQPMPLRQQVEILYAAVNGHLDDLPVAKLQSFETAFHRHMESNHPEIGRDIEEQKQITPEIEEKLKAAILQFKETAPY